MGIIVVSTKLLEGVNKAMFNILKVDSFQIGVKHMVVSV